MLERSGTLGISYRRVMTKSTASENILNTWLSKKKFQIAKEKPVGFAVKMYRLEKAG
jgi:hypothetical protein